MQILLYITADKDRYLGGDPLTLCLGEDERDEYLQSFARALHADVVRLSNGDHMVVR